jgi:hypothetical protein
MLGYPSRLRDHAQRDGEALREGAWEGTDQPIWRAGGGERSRACSCLVAVWFGRSGPYVLTRVFAGAQSFCNRRDSERRRFRGSQRLV